MKMMIREQHGMNVRVTVSQRKCHHAWHGVQSNLPLPKDAIISSDIGNNCAIGNAYPTFEEGRKYLAPGLFGPCGYGLPSIMGAKIGRRDVPVVGFAGDGAFGISMNEMSAIGREEWPAITMVIFRNYQWGAEKRNTTLWFDDNFVGTELDQQVSYAGVAKACGVEGRCRFNEWMSFAMH
jgi:sulfoacetaldehyde acetyltransferase